ncbi:type I restriction endonuclease [Limibacter armeniacum]|uniref:type I restriction endonuclease n=1 Tax=Limibacter armeniacum TaxID=466084 RepID=UPI002FE5911D
MDFVDKLRSIADRITKMKDQVATEEATKNAFVMPFLSALGYDVFNPMEVVPEFIADIGTKKGEKVDYCILKDGAPAIIIECKHWKEKLDVHSTQLHRYFHVTTAKFGILTNGFVYRFYSDLEQANKMDDQPFLEFDFENFNENLVNELKKFTQEAFDIDRIVDSASDLKYSKQIIELLAGELREPSDDFVKHFATKVYTGRLTEKVKEQFTGLVKKSARILISEMINERLKSAMDEDTNLSIDTANNSMETSSEENTEEEDKGIFTTVEEMDGFRIIQAMLRKEVPLDRVQHRDTKSYFGVLMDDNNRKPVCRLHFNRSQKYIGLFDENKVETRHPIERLEDLFTFEGELLKTARLYLDN